MEGSGLTCISVPAADYPVHEERERRAGKWEKQIKSSPSCRPFEDTTKINDIISVARIRSLAQKTKSSVSREGGGN